MQVAYIHIGTGKTGTSSIQIALAKNRRILRGHGFSYLRSGLIAKGHHKLAAAFGARQGFDKNVPVNPERLRRQLMREVARAKGNIIVSSELLRGLKGGQIPDFMDVFSKTFTVKIVVFVRAQDRYFESLYNQMLKNRRVDMGFEEFLESEYRARCDYKELLDVWAGHVGAENMIVVPYEKSQLPKGSVVGFLEAIGITSNDPLKAADKRDNPSLTPFGMAFARAFEELNPSYRNDFLNFAGGMLGGEQAIYSESGAPKLFSRQERQEFVKSFQDQNAEIAREYLGRDDGRLFYETPSSDDHARIEFETMPVRDAVALAASAFDRARQYRVQRRNRRRVVGVILFLLGLGLGLVF